MAAIRHPVRVAILDEFIEHELASPGDMAKRLGLPIGTVGYHFGRLVELGFLELAKREQRRGATAHFYRLREGADASAPDDDLLRALVDPDSITRTELSVVLDDVAIGDLRVSVQSLYAQMRQLERATVTRTGAERRAYTVHVAFDLRSLPGTRREGGARRARAGSNASD